MRVAAGMKKAQIQVISVVLILLVLAVSSVTLFNWTQNFSNELQTKNIQNPRTVGKDITVLGLEQKNGILSAILRSPITGYKKIDRITLNGENCTLIGTNVITEKSISQIPIDCPTINEINNLVIYTKYNVIEKSDSITLANEYLSCLGPDSSIVAHLGSSIYYESSKSDFGESCNSETRVCNNGVLSGNYNVSSCVEDIPVSSNSISLKATGDYLSWTPTQEGDRKVWTWSSWVKLHGEHDYVNLFGRAIDSQNYEGIFFYIYEGGPKLFYLNEISNVLRGYYNSEALFREYSDWVHVLYSKNSSAGLINIEVNGIKLDLVENAALQDLNGFINTINTHYIGKNAANPTEYGNAYLAEINFVDGQTLNSSNFGRFDSYGKWVPKEYAGTYGANGFHLTFENSSNLGQDFSGNGNDWTVSGTPAQTKDIPENNFATLNPLVDELAPLSNGNLVSAYYTGGSNIWKKSSSTLGTSDSGKYYWEVKINKAGGGYPMLGAFRDEVWSGDEASDTAGGRFQFHTGPGFGGYSTETAGFFIEGVTQAEGFDAGINDVVGFALDLDNLKVDIYVNNILNRSYSNLIKGSYYPSASHTSFYDTEVEFNFGSTNFTYIPPEGFKPLSSKNLKVPAVIPSQGFDIISYTGTGAIRSLTGLDFSPSLVWIKNRDQVDDHKLFDILRGPTNYMETNTIDIEATDINSLTSFDSNGFSLGTGANGFNDLNENFVSWNWKEGSEFGFDIVNYTGNGVMGRQIQHNLNKTPEFMIFFNLDFAQHPTVYHKDVGANAGLYTSQIVVPQATSAFFNNENPTSNYFVVGNAAQTNYNIGSKYVTYLFTSIEGFSKIGSYTGNGNTDGPFIYTGFKPKYVMIKAASTTGSWKIISNPPSTNNPAYHNLVASSNAAEVSPSNWLDFLSNGFKLRAAVGTEWNGNNEDYIYIAFAEYPLSNNY